MRIKNRFNVVYHLLCISNFYGWDFNFLNKDKTMSKEMREQINNVKNFGQFLNENNYGI